MRKRVVRGCVGLCSLLCAWSAPPEALSAQSTRAAAPAGVRAYFEAFAAKHILSVQTAEVRELREQLAQAEALAEQGRFLEASLLLTDLTEHPRFADYAELSELSAAHYALAGALFQQGAARGAQDALREVLARGPTDPYFAPAFRRYVDIARRQRQLGAAVRDLSAVAASLPQDAADELSYVRARERMQAGDDAAAELAYQRVSPTSRFYASAQFELGALAAEQRAYDAAETHLCRVTQASDDSPRSLLSDARYYPVKDLARLGLGRIAHERRDGEAAFDQYFQVPADSPRLPEALFEAAYARYEADDPDTALDLLDQLQARFPRSPYADEASLLRGYVALARCDFGAAEQQFSRFEARFAPVHQALARTLRNPSRREALYEALRQPSPDAARSQVQLTLMALLRRDPAFEELHQRVQQLDRQAAGASRLPGSFALLRARYLSGDRPLPALPAQDTAVESAQALDALRLTVEDTRIALRALSEQLDELRAAGAAAAELAEQERRVAALAARQHELRAGLEAARLALAPRPEPDAAAGASVADMLQRDEANARGFEARARRLRQRLVRAANQKALRELRALEARLGSFLRRARIGHIDAVMGKKGDIEREIQSLAKGRFPAELRAREHKRAYLADDEEYWPYEGEDWADERQLELEQAPDESMEQTLDQGQGPRSSSAVLRGGPP